MTALPVAAICRTLGMARRTAYYTVSTRADGFYRRREDETVLRQIRAVTNSRASYGTRRTRTMVNEACGTSYDRKRIQRLMRMHGLMLAPRVHRRAGRPHLGQVIAPGSDQRWCTDILLIPCWSGEVVSVAFVLDGHDRELLAHVAAPRTLRGGDIRVLMERALWHRFGERALSAPRPIQWLSDNGPQFTATETVFYARELGLEPITTPAYSPQSNGLAESWVKTLKRDYVAGADLRDAESVLLQLEQWIEDYNTRAPHSALGMRSPVAYRAEVQQRSQSVQ